MWLLIVCLVLLYLLRRSLLERFRYDLHRIPAPPKLPISGHAFTFVFGEPAKYYIRWMRRVRRELGEPKLVRVDIFGRRILFVADEELCQKAVYDRQSTFLRGTLEKSSFYCMMGDLREAKAMLTTAETTPYVKAIRKIYLQAFQSSSLKAAMPGLTGVIDRMISQVEARRVHGPFDCQELFVRMTLDAIGVVAFEADLGGLDGSRPLHDLIIAAGFIGRKWTVSPMTMRIADAFPKFGPGKQKVKLEQLRAQYRWIADEILKRENPSDGREPIWFGLKNVIDPEMNKPIPYESLLAEIATVVFSGMDTTGHQLAWIVALLASHPHVVDSLMAELKGKGLSGASPREITFEDIGELEYLAAIVKEGMRFAHAFPNGISRVVPQDMSILGYRVPKGTFLKMLGNRTVRSVEDWGDPDVFRPERWLSGEDHSNKYNVGFLKGPRDCVGQRFAVLEMKLTIMKLVVRYEFTLEGSYEKLAHNATNGLVIEAENGVWLNATLRSPTE